MRDSLACSKTMQLKIHKPTIAKVVQVPTPVVLTEHFDSGPLMRSRHVGHVTYLPGPLSTCKHRSPSGNNCEPEVPAPYSGCVPMLGCFVPSNSSDAITLLTLFLYIFNILCMNVHFRFEISNFGEKRRNFEKLTL